MKRIILVFLILVAIRVEAQTRMIEWKHPEIKNVSSFMLIIDDTPYLIKWSCKESVCLARIPVEIDLKKQHRIVVVAVGKYGATPSEAYYWRPKK
jgi:hypothetical protein